MSIKLTNCSFIGQTKAGINYDADTKEEIILENSHFREQPVGINVYRRSILEKFGSNEAEILGLLNTLKIGNTEDFNVLMNILNNHTPEKHLKIVEDSKFLKNLAILADTTGLAGFIVTIATTPNFQETIRMLWHLVSKQYSL